MRIIDISMEISEDMIIYKNKEIKKPRIETISSHNNSEAHESNIYLNLHTGTHVDAPLHMIKDGATMEAYNLDKFYGECYVIDFTSIENGITREDLLYKNIKENDIIIMKTNNSNDLEFNYSFVYLDESGAKYLVDKKIKTVGIDALGIERNQENHGTHKVLLGNNIPIIEGLSLKEVEEGRYLFIGFPIKIKEVEASFIRAILITDN